MDKTNVKNKNCASSSCFILYIVVWIHYGGNSATLNSLRPLKPNSF